MKMNIIIKLRYLLFIQIFVIQFFVESCRDEIISPANSLAPVNQPVSVIENDYYSFDIDAQNISFVKIENPQIHSTTSKLSIILTNYISGYVSVRIVEQSGYILYLGKFNNNSKRITKEFNAQIPDKIVYNFHNFSGTLKVKLSGI